MSGPVDALVVVARRHGEALGAIAAAALALLVVLLGLAIAGFSAVDVAAQALRGAFGSTHRLIATAEQAMPLALCGLAAGVAFRAGVANIGGEGQYLVGALAFAAIAAALPASSATAAGGIVVAGVAGAAYAGVAWALERARGVPMVLSTILLNLVAGGLVAVLVTGALHDPATQAPQTAQLPPADRLAAFGPHLGVWLALVATLAVWTRQRATAGGFASGIVGENPVAAALVGMPVARVRALATAGSGALAGAAGALQTAGVTHQLSLGTGSFGYAGIAVALLGRLHPVGIAVAALFFAALDTGASQVERRLGVPRDVADVAKGIAVCAVLAAVALAARGARRRVA